MIYYCCFGLFGFIKGQGAATNREKSRASLGQGRALRPVKTGYREH
jgi:hypothetical protein